MASLESAYFAVEQLAKDFKANQNHYLRPEYSESQARIDFIDKFFTALGWDVYHAEQKNPYEQEVKVERNVAVGAAQKRADYAFCLSPNFRDPKFYAEAKKPSRSLSNADDYFQAIRYGWNSRNPFAVLTDFEEFHVIDSRSKPNIKTALLFGIKKYSYNDYLDKDKFAEIYYLFSREAVENGSLEKYAESLGKPKKSKTGKSATAEAIDESFLVELDKIRDILAKSFKRRNPALTSPELTEATQRTIDRLVFLRFLEDKLIEGESHIDHYIARKSAWDEFITDSKALNAKYNGVVFRNHPVIDSDKFIAPDDKDFRGICEKLSFKNSPYHFNFIPIHILGSIYERFLGKVVHATDKRVSIEDKPEVRKAGGVYYTPQYIVQYIVENTIGKIIEGKTPQEISKLRFADISCGSGSFLITVYDTLLAYHGKWYQLNPAQAKKDECIEKNGIWILSIEQKKDILLNNIYGVDIDYQAVEVTQLSLYLKLLEDESQASILQEEMFYKNKKVLPDLSKNIVCGNSLIGTDIFEGQMFPTEEQVDINAMNFEDAFPEIMKKGGFDAIVGNPPWGVDFGEIELTYFRTNYDEIIVRMIDSFMYFVYKASKLIRPMGYFGMILPDVLLYQNDNYKLRKFLLDNFRLSDLINLGNGVFRKVTRPSAIITFQNVKSKENILKVMDLTDAINKEEKIHDNNTSQVNQSEYLKVPSLAFVTKNIENYAILDKIRGIPNQKLSNYVDDDGIQRGVSPDLKEAFIVDSIIVEKNKLEKSNIKKVVTGGKQVKRYGPIDEEKYLIYTSRETDYSKIPNICKYIENFRNQITCVEVKQKKHSIYSLHRARDEKIFLKKLKILGVITEDEIIVTIDRNMFYATDGIYLFTPISISELFLIGILNSRLFVFLYRLFSFEAGRVLAQVKPTVIANLPIRIIDFKNAVEKGKHDKLAFLVEKILDAKKRLTSATTEKDKTYYENMCNTIDRQIDELVYDLYGLTEEEIKIVEGK